MYKVKSKQGFNVILKDLGLTLRPNGDWAYISKEDFDNSRDAKKMASLIIKEDANSIIENKTSESAENVIQVGNGAFVIEGRTYKNPDDVFIAQPTPIQEVIPELISESESESESELESITEVIEIPEVQPEKTEVKESAKTAVAKTVKKNTNTQKKNEKSEK